MPSTISNVVITPSTIYPGDTVTIEFDLYNGTGKKIISLYPSLYKYRSGASNLDSLVRVTKNNLNHGNNTTVHYSFTTQALSIDADDSVFGYMSDNDIRAVGAGTAENIYLLLSYTAVSGSQQETGGIQAATNPATLLYMHCYPTIDVLSLERSTSLGVPDDEGESVLMTAKLGIVDDTWLSGMSCRLYWAQGSTVDPATAQYIDLTSSITALLASEVTTVISGTYARGDDWAFMMAFGDLETAYSGVELVPVAFANFHLSGAALGGAAFGRFSSADDTHPKLECEYPAYFSQPVHADGGIAGVTTYPLLASGATATDEELTGGTWVDGKPIYRKVFTGTTTSTGTVTVASLGASVGTMISMHGAVLQSSNSRWYPVPYADNDGAQYSYGARYDISDGNLKFSVGSGRTGSKTYHIIVEYTKTTD